MEDTTLKTQIRFGKKDIEIFVKNKGEGVPFRQIKIKEFTDITKVPCFDHSIKWRRYVDKPPRRVVSRPARGEQQSTSPSSQQASNPLIRQHSTGEGTDDRSKKTKLDSRSSDEDMDDDMSDCTVQPAGRIERNRK